VQKPGEAFEPGEIHARRERRSDRDHRNPEQPLADTHLIPGVAPRCERQRQGRSERSGPLLGPETGPLGPPCAVSVPNLMTDRGLGLAVDAAKLNVRRLMYQSLIWSGILRDDARGLRPAFDPEDVKRAADSLVDGVRRDAEPAGDFLRRLVLDQEIEHLPLLVGEPAKRAVSFEECLLHVHPDSAPPAGMCHRTA